MIKSKKENAKAKYNLNFLQFLKMLASKNSPNSFLQFGKQHTETNLVFLYFSKSFGTKSFVNSYLNELYPFEAQFLPFKYYFINSRGQFL